MNLLLSLRKCSLPVIAFASLITFTGCDKDDDDNDNMNDNTISGKVVATAEFSTLETALIRASLVEALKGTGPFTVFAPDNDAFAASGITESALNSLPVPALQSILQYHVLTSKINSGAVPAGPNAKVVTLSGDSVFVTKNSSGVFVNGSKVKTADIEASNGVIHSISNVLMPPGNNNIVQIAQADTSLTYLVAAVVRASTGATNVATVLSTTNALTVFAPTNQAFIKAGFPTIASIQSADPATLIPILTYHVIPSRVFSSDLSEGAQPTTVNGGKVTISLTGGAKVKGAKNASAAAITNVNIMAKNGVIHKIDQVLLP